MELKEFQLDASCTEDVVWDNLLDGRPGDVCRKLWNLMVLHIGDNGNKSLPDQVEVPANRYCLKPERPGIANL
ncbi:hypothetical protein ACH5RR_039926 [Cinchona calisaya]|uniref:Uncharacterized protein n=1 Tax=Cinchona calisaya TaxID=153742 RepID=A0ABD2Y032_9GENT